MNERKQYLEYIYKLKNLPESELANLSFDNVKIKAIKNFDGSDEMAARASATVSATLKLTKFNYKASDKRTHASATFSGSWKGTPFYKNQDTIGIGVIGSLSRFVKKVLQMQLPIMMVVLYEILMENITLQLGKYTKLVLLIII